MLALGSRISSTIKVMPSELQSQIIIKEEVRRLVNSLKRVSTRLLRQEFPELVKYCLKAGLCSPSYFIASCGGAPLDIVKEYIEKL